MMPFYSVRCSNGHSDTIYSRVDNRDDVRQCPRCGANLTRLLDAPAVRGDITPYQSPVDGRWIDSSRARKEDLKRNNAIEWEPGFRQDAPRLRQEAQDKAFAPLEATIEQTARELTAAGKFPTL